ncbi:conjugative transposon protein TraN [Dinghuibacter silviterrae]|uniref:Conjugative transposon TraN protein n=1 Tax=Dinghuibacter silviterrae TaxID=1539049 RepID=A0A4V3GLQ5_9BACT|nr:conjugative transposon protein TraN [Dinghuibacter silviterrae]TDX00513.1 conjugative transposon TraN protein [Dinghuibacter silviterrae]
MNRILFLAAITAMLMTRQVQAQVFNFSPDALSPAYSLDISWHITTLLVFPCAIQSADRGDRYILAEKVKGVENVLKVKAGEKGFQPSNLHVITRDGKVYTFDVHYMDTPAYQTVDLRRQDPFAPVEFDGVSLNSKELADFSALVSGSEPFLKGVHSNRNGLTFTMDGIFIRHDVIFLRYLLKNNTAIGYEEGALRFFIRDKKRMKRTAEEDREVLPLYLLRSGSPENDNGEIIVVAFPKFTIAENKDFVTELMEAGGDRNAACKLDEGKLLKAKALLR